jgi:beta-lactamase regulating signal transducer with metallopeptidase domain
MNEILIAILIPIILTGIAYGVAEFLMKFLKIHHPKNMFFVYFIIFLITICLVPITSLSQYETDANDLANSSSIETISDVSAEELANISSSPISSKIIPFHNTHDKLNSESLNSKFIIEISWYDFIRDTNTSENKILQQTSATDQQPIEKENNDASLLSIIKNGDFVPPLLLITIFLFIISVFFVIYHLFFIKNHFLKKIKANPTENSQLVDLITMLSKELNIKTPQVFLFDGAPNAFVMGFPAILVISNKLIDVLTYDELKTTLRHELTHIKQHDITLKAFIQATRIVCFYNPFIHILAKKIFNKRELLADTEYNVNKKDKISFMEALIKITEYAQTISSVDTFSNPAISVSLMEFSSAHPSMTERFLSLFKQCKKKTLLTLFVSFIIIFTNTSAVLLTHTCFNQFIKPETPTTHPVNVEEQYLIEDITYTSFYKNNDQTSREKMIMVHKTLYNVISIPSFMNETSIQEIIDYILLSYYRNQQISSAF